jgi:hypothetical protein
MKAIKLTQITSLLLLAGALNLQAASGTWTGANDATWAGANWSTTPVPGSADVATFNGAGNANTTIDLGGGVTILNLLFNTGSAAAYTVGAGAVGSQTLTLNDAGAITLNSTVVNNQLFHSALVLGLDATAKGYSFANNSASTLTLAANITGGSTGVGGVKTLTVGGSGNIVFGGNLYKGTPTSGTTDIALAKIGAGTFTVNPVSNVGSAAGAITINAGTLAIDFVNAGANASLLSSFSPVTLTGGTLQIIGNGANASTQTFGGVTFNAGFNQISAGNNSPTVTLGAWTPVLGGAVMLTGPATTTYSGGNSVTPTSVSATATITTTTAGLGNFGLVQKVASGTAANLGAYATVGLYDWASTDLAAGTAGTSPYTIIGGSQVSGFYTATFGANTDVPAAGIALGSGTQYGSTLRFNTPSATAFTPTFVSNPNGDNVQCQGILVTPNMGAQNAGISGSTWSPYYGTTGAKVNTMQVWQNNTLGYFNFAAGYYNGRSGASVNSLVQNGSGTVVYSAANTQTGPTFLNGGCSVIGADAAFGTPATAAAVNLNGGTVVATNTLTLDNAGANPRPIILLGNGGGLAAAAGLTLTVDGQIQSAAGTGPLVIGIPASAANGSVAGLVPGTGSIANGQTVDTANTTPVFGNGTVALTYPNSANGNYFFGGVTIVGGATLKLTASMPWAGRIKAPQFQQRHAAIQPRRWRPARRGRRWISAALRSR